MRFKLPAAFSLQFGQVNGGTQVRHHVVPLVQGPAHHTVPRTCAGRAANSVGAPHLQFAGHSFLIGAATMAAMVGVEDSMIRTLGRWHSTAFLQYIWCLSSPVSYPRQGKRFSNPPLNLVSAPTPLNVVIHIQLVIIYVCLYATITPSCMLYNHSLMTHLVQLGI